MSLETKAEKLLEAVTALITAVTSLVQGDYTKNATGQSIKVEGGATGQSLKAEGGATQSPTTKTKVPTKKEIAELKKVAKACGGELIKKFGKEAGRVKLSELLAVFGATKFTDLQEDAHIFTDFAGRANVILGQEPEATTEADDLLGGDIVEPAKVYTAEDVRMLALEVQTKHGKDAMRQILTGELGVQRLPELKKEKFAAAVSLLETELAKDVDPLGAE